MVAYRWEIAPHWEQEHHVEIAVARLEADGSVDVCSELLSSWPYRHGDLTSELQGVGLTVERSTFDPTADNYTVVATKDQAAPRHTPWRPDWAGGGRS
ncbi:hypothetical protein ACFUC1_00650 [Pedococcus sp. NPDC057267]|uniref:hypothetical protein n=1 Tax=Pedococcus sp. NPDC057267 TaxID=3346077 RepID=UPI00362A5375